MLRRSFFLGILLSGAVLGGCNTFFSKEKTSLVGDRESIFLNSHDLRTTSSIKPSAVSVAQAEHRSNWPMASGNADHAISPMELSASPKKVWETSIGSAGSGSGRLLNGPVVADGMVYAVDAEGLVTATSLATGERVWEETTLENNVFTQPFGGGVAWDSGYLYVTTPAAELVCLDAGQGTVVWREKLAAPVRSSPTVHKGRVYVATISNQLDAFDTTTGRRLWTHAGIVESAGLLGGASPAVQGDVIVVAYTSGEIYALHGENGYPLWSESLNMMNAMDSVSALAHIKARPVIEGGLVYLISHGGRMSAIDLRTGQTVWSRELGGIRTPAVSKGFLFMLTNENQLVCLEQKTGKVVWVKLLPRYKNDDEKDEKILWAGPILAGKSLVLSGSNGRVIFCSPQGGEIEKGVEAERPILLSPIVADRTLLALSQEGNLIAFR